MMGLFSLAQEFDYLYFLSGNNTAMNSTEGHSVCLLVQMAYKVELANLMENHVVFLDDYCIY